jgi:hypothetical protein
MADPRSERFEPVEAAGLERTARGPLVLLFYDGYERRAAPGMVGAIRSQSRRAARFIYNNALGRQVRTGFYTAFLSLVRCLRQAGCDVRINDFAAAAARPGYPIGMAGYPTVLERVRLANPVIFGPGDFGAPEPARVVAADERFHLLIQPCSWYVDYYRPYCGAKLMSWFAGIDLDDWADVSEEAKTVDCLIYDKIRWERESRIPAVLNRVEHALDARELSHRTLRYGAHRQATFRRELRQARSLIFLCEHETQGLAYQEAMASGLPVLAWDEGELVDPLQRPFADPSLRVSSVPYFDARCGIRFKLNEFEGALDEFRNRVGGFDPRGYVRECLSMAEAASRYLVAYGSIVDSGLT